MRSPCFANAPASPCACPFLFFGILSASQLSAEQSASVRVTTATNTIVLCHACRTIASNRSSRNRRTMPVTADNPRSHVKQSCELLLSDNHAVHMTQRLASGVRGHHAHAAKEPEIKTRYIAQSNSEVSPANARDEAPRHRPWLSATPTGPTTTDQAVTDHDHPRQTISQWFRLSRHNQRQQASGCPQSLNDRLGDMVGDAHPPCFFLFESMIRGTSLVTCRMTCRVSGSGGPWCELVIVDNHQLPSCAKE